MKKELNNNTELADYGVSHDCDEDYGDSELSDYDIIAKQNAFDLRDLI